MAIKIIFLFLFFFISFGLFYFPKADLVEFALAKPVNRLNIRRISIQQTQKEEKRIRELADKLKKDPDKKKLGESLPRQIRERSKNFVIIYKPDKTKEETKAKRDLIQGILGSLESKLDKCIEDFACSAPKEPILVVVIDSQKEFEAIFKTPESAKFNRNFNTIFIKIEGLSADDLNHEMGHAVSEQEKGRLFGRSFLHWRVEEGLGVSREEGDRHKRLIQSLFVTLLGWAKSYDAEAILLYPSHPQFRDEQEASDFYAQSGSLIMFFLEKGLTYKDLLQLQKEIVEARERGLNDNKVRDIIRKFLGSRGIRYDTLDAEWLRWQRERVINWQKDLDDFRRKELKPLRERLKKENNPLIRKQLEDSIKSIEETIKEMGWRSNNQK